MEKLAHSFRILLQPEGKEILCPAGLTLAEAAAKAGILILTPCGGQGRCGKCLVQIKKGKVAYEESPRLTKEQQEQGWVLACQAKVFKDATIFIPPLWERELLALQASKTAKLALDIRCPFPPLPVLQEIYLKLPPPNLQDNLPDLERVKKALQKQGLEIVEWDIDALRRLPQKLREGDFEISLLLNSRGISYRIMDIYPGQRKRPLLGVAVDVGTTNIALALVDLRSGKVVDKASARNKQVVRGEDVISRIIYTEKNKEGLTELQELVISTINDLICEVTGKNNINPQEIGEMVVAGNTIMTHIFLGIPVTNLRKEPYVPVASYFPLVRSTDIGVGIHSKASIYCLPAVSAYVGGDITAGVLSSGLFKAGKLTLFMDIGTNGELVIGNSDWLTTCACSAGPAFEGYGVVWGMRAIEGAIEEVRINSLTLEPTLRVIGNKPPEGICGAGMITALSEMLITGVIDRAGRINVELVQERTKDRPRVRYGEWGAEYILAFKEETGIGKDIVLTEADINNLIRAKGAIYAGITVMLNQVGLNLSKLEEVLIGGAFGQHINIEGAINIGLLPDLTWERFKFLGNTSLAGAYNCLISKAARSIVEETASRMTYFELIADSSFMDQFSASLFLPHTNLELFTSVKKVLG